MKRHIVLVGLPGAGKSTAGRLAAARLGAPFLDGDELVVRRVGKAVGRIFVEDGEATFRDHERRAVVDALAGPPAVVAPGGGWAAWPGNLDTARHALVVHLAVAPAVARHRMGETDRPLLRPDPAAVLERLATERFPLYARAAAVIRTDQLNATQVADLIAELARSKGGW